MLVKVMPKAELMKQYEKPKLTNKEKDILHYLYETNLSNQNIAQNLEISLASVKFHAWNIYNKLGVNKRIELKSLDPNYISSLINCTEVNL